MQRTGLQQLGDSLGMFAYLAAIGALRYWPAVRNITLASNDEPYSDGDVTAGKDAASLSDRAQLPKKVVHQAASMLERIPA